MDTISIDIWQLHAAATGLPGIIAVTLICAAFFFAYYWRRR
jgi:hypothetical protein